MSALNCPVCKRGSTVAAINPEGKDLSVFYCEVCGTFEISGTLEVQLMHKSANPKLSYALRKRFDGGEKNSINNGNINDVIDSVSYPETIIKKIIEIIKYLYGNKDIATKGLPLGDQESYRFGISNNDELSLVMRTSEDKNLLEFNPKFASGGGICFISGDGILFAEELKVKEKNMIKSMEKEEGNNFNSILGMLAGTAGLIGVASVVDSYLDNKSEADEFKKIKEKYENRAKLIGQISDSKKLKENDETAYSILIEIIQMFVYGFNRASVVFCGALIDHLLKKQGYANNFKQNIEDAKSKNLISENEYYRLHTIRADRNYYIHEIDTSISNDDTVFVINLTIKMLERLI